MEQKIARQVVENFQAYAKATTGKKVQALNPKQVLLMEGMIEQALREYPARHILQTDVDSIPDHVDFVKASQKPLTEKGNVFVSLDGAINGLVNSLQQISGKKLLWEFVKNTEDKDVLRVYDPKFGEVKNG